MEAYADGKIASMISVESGHSIGTSLAVLRMFHRLGAISLTLTHNCNTPWYVYVFLYVKAQGSHFQFLIATMPEI